MMLLRKIEVRLKESPFLAGEELSIADIAVGTCLRPLFVNVLGEVERKNNQNMCVWIDKLYKSVRSEVVFLINSPPLWRCLGRQRCWFKLRRVKRNSISFSFV